MALSYDIIQRGQVDKEAQKSSLSGASPRSFTRPTSEEISKKSSLDLLHPDPQSPRSTQMGQSEEKKDSVYTGRTAHISQETLGKSMSPRNHSDFEYHVNEPYVLDNSSPKNASFAEKKKKSTIVGRFSENTLQIPVDESFTSPPRFEAQPSQTSPILSGSHYSAGKHQMHRNKEKMATTTPSRNNGTKALNRSSRSVSPAATGRKPYSEKTLVDVIKFRKTKEGNYVKELLTPKEKREDHTQSSKSCLSFGSML